LGEALAEYRDALVLAREVGHKSSEGIDLQLIGNVLMEQGDLNAATQMFQQAADIQRQINDQSYYAATLVSIGNLHRQRGDLEGAKKFYEDALSLRQQLGEKGSVADSEVPLAELACDSNQGAIAVKFARDAVQEFQHEKESDAQILALALLSRGLLQQGKIGEAQAAIAEAKTLAAKSSDVAIRLVFEVDRAYALAAAKDFRAAERLAKSAFAEANKLGFVQTQMEASLALGEIQLMGQNQAAGRVVLRQLAKDARARGFALITKKASAALESGSVK